VTGTHAVKAPADLSYHQLEDLLQLLPAEPRARRTVELPPGTERGFLVAMTAMISTSTGPCRSGRREDVSNVGVVPYLYNQTLYDLSITSCRHKPERRTSPGSLSDVIDGRFQVRNRRTGHITKFQLAYGLSEGLHGVPVRIVFRPRWWMELELVLRRDDEVVEDAASRNGGRT
jgi:hypothetical protein